MYVCVQIDFHIFELLRDDIVVGCGSERGCWGLHLELATSDIYHSRGQRVDGIFHRRLVSIDFR